SVEAATREERVYPTTSVVTHQNRLRQRIVTVVGQREQHPAAALDQADLPGPPREDEGRCLLALAAHLQLAPPHAHLRSGAQGLEPRLLGGESRREVRRRIAPRTTIHELAVRGQRLREPG